MELLFFLQSSPAAAAGSAAAHKHNRTCRRFIAARLQCLNVILRWSHRRRRVNGSPGTADKTGIREALSPALHNIIRNFLRKPTTLLYGGTPTTRNCNSI